MSANPVIETRRELVTVCPADLANAPAKKPVPPADAVVQYNGPGGAYLAALVAWGSGLFDTISDARADCPETAR